MSANDEEGRLRFRASATAVFVSEFFDPDAGVLTFLYKLSGGYGTVIGAFTGDASVRVSPALEVVDSTVTIVAEDGSGTMRFVNSGTPTAYVVTGGTGRFAEATGIGTFEATGLGTLELTWDGTLRLDESDEDADGGNGEPGTPNRERRV